MEDAKLNIQDEEEEFDDALDDFPFYDCEESFPDSFESNGAVCVSFLNHKELPENKTTTSFSRRRRRKLFHRRSAVGDSTEFSELNSSVSLENFPKFREGKKRISFEIKECERKLENENSYPVELKSSLEGTKDIVYGENNENNDERSALTDANSNIIDGLVGDELNLRESYEEHSSFIFTLAAVMIKVISFQIDLLVKFFVFPLWLIYYLHMLVFDPFGILKCAREYLIQKMKRNWSFVFENMSPFVYEWLKEHKAICKLGLKCCWGLVWSSYVCAVLVALFLSAFVMGGLLIREMVEEPMRMSRNLNFDYTEKSPVAFVPITARPELNHEAYIEEKPEIGRGSRSGGIPPNHKLQVTVSLVLPESEYNQNLGIFQVRVDFLAADGQTLASSRRPCMLQYRSQPIRLFLTFLKVAPILTGCASETQNLKINFKRFSEGDMRTACLRVVIEQRAEFVPGAGIPQIYAASLTLESELPLLKKAIWFWKRTLFVWISMTIFIMELAFALICCKPIIIPKIRLREATNRSASPTGRSGPS